MPVSVQRKAFLSNPEVSRIWRWTSRRTRETNIPIRKFRVSLYKSPVFEAILFVYRRPTTLSPSSRRHSRSFEIFEEPNHKHQFYERSRSPSPRRVLSPYVHINYGSSEYGDDDSSDEEKDRKNFENARISSNFRRRSRSAGDEPSTSSKDQEESDEPRRHSAKIPGYEVFPKHERNYILMELESSRRSPVRKGDDSSRQKDNDHHDGHEENKDSVVRNDPRIAEESPAIRRDFEPGLEDSNWEELGLVDEEVLLDFHNKVSIWAKVIMKHLIILERFGLFVAVILGSKCTIKTKSGSIDF